MPFKLINLNNNTFNINNGDVEPEIFILRLMGDTHETIECGCAHIITLLLLKCIAIQVYNGVLLAVLHSYL